MGHTRDTRGMWGARRTQGMWGHTADIHGIHLGHVCDEGTRWRRAGRVRGARGGSMGTHGMQGHTSRAHGVGGTCGDIHGTCIGHIRGTRGMWRARRRHTGDTRGTQRGYVGDTGHLQDTENAHTGHWNMRGSSRGEGAGGTEDTTWHRHAGDRQSHETRRGPARGHLGDRTLEPWHTQGTDRGHSRDTKDPGREK